MGNVPDMRADGFATMVRADSSRAWWESDTRKARQLDADVGIDEWSKAAGLDFTVQAMESGFLNPETQTWHKEDHRRTIVRLDNYVGLGHFTTKYKIHQPSQILDFFRNFLLVDPRFTLSTMGSMQGGANIWALAEFGKGREIAGALHRLYCLLGTSYNGSWATFASATTIRAVCENTVAATIYAKDSEASQTFRVKHSAAFDSVNQAKALDALARTSAQFDTFRDFAESLATIKMTRDETLLFLNKLLTGRDTMPTREEIDGTDDKKSAISPRTRGAMADLVNSLSVTLGEPGTQDFTAWTAFNAVTRYVDHDRTTRRNLATKETEGQARLFSANFGSGADMKRDAVQMIAKQFPGMVKLAPDAKELIAA